MKLYGKVCLVAVICLLIFGSPVFCQEKVGKAYRIGGLFDITGPTNAIGAPFARGVKDYVAYLNSQGGIGGVQVDLISIDYQYNAQQSLTGFTRLTTSDYVLGLLGWGSVDLPLLKPKVNALPLPTISAAARGQDVVGEFSPYIFAIAGTYADEILTQMSWIQMDAKKKGISKPKVALLFTEPGRADRKKLNDLNAYERMGFELVAEEFISVRAVSAASQMARVSTFSPDYILGLVTVSPGALILKEAAQLGMKTTFCFGFFAANRVLLEIVGDAAKSLLVSSPVAYYSETSVSGIQTMRKFAGEAYLPVQYVAGWVGGMVLTEGIKRANLNPEMSVEKARVAIKDGLESFRNVDMDGLTLPMTFTSTDHIGTKGFKIYGTDLANKYFVPITGRYDVPDFARK